MQTQVHGTNFEHYEQRALTDARLIAEYEFPDEAAENAEAQMNLDSSVTRSIGPLAPVRIWIARPVFVPR
jgi:hypothetical protein